MSSNFMGAKVEIVRCDQVIDGNGGVYLSSKDLVGMRATVVKEGVVSCSVLLDDGTTLEVHKSCLRRVDRTFEEVIAELAHEESVYAELRLTSIDESGPAVFVDDMDPDDAATALVIHRDGRAYIRRIVSASLLSVISSACTEIAAIYYSKARQ